MGTLTDLYIAGKIGGAIGEGIGNRLAASVQNGAALYQDSSAVNNMRQRIYDTKKSIAASSFTRDILNSILNNQAYPPCEILISATGAITSPIEENGRAYNPAGVLVYEAETAISYEVCAALCLIIQDMYPNTYDMNKMTINELLPRLQNGTWFTSLIMKPQMNLKTQTPAFTPDDLYNKPIEQLPFTTKDPLKKGRGVFLGIAFLLAILCIVFAWIVRSPFLGLMAGIAAIVFSIISLVKASKFGIFPIIIATFGLGRALLGFLIDGRFI